MDDTMQTTTEQQTDDNAQIIVSLTELIKSHEESIRNIKATKKQHKQMLDDAFRNDPVYQEHLKAFEAAKNTLEGTKMQIAKQPANIELARKVKDMAAELKEKKAALSDYALEYQRITKATQLDLFDGQIGEIVLSAKIVRKAKKRRKN